MEEKEKPLVWLKTKVKTPPFSHSARLTAGYLLRKLQRGESLPMPDMRSMPTIGSRCCELRIPDNDKKWRIICRIDDDAIVVVSIFTKKTQKTPQREIKLAKDRLRDYDELVRG